jgi:hypothetical protein
MTQMERVQGSVTKMFPGRFLEASDLAGRMVTVTIARPYNDGKLAGALEKQYANVLGFVGKKKELLLNVTNARFIEAMFPGDPNTVWPGKRICLQPAKTNFGRDVVDCIRVSGSPDIAEDKRLSIRIGLKVVKVTLKAVKVGDKTAPEPEPEQDPEPDPAMVEAWSHLGWSREQGMKDHGEYLGTDYLAHLSVLIDQENAKEGAF